MSSLPHSNSADPSPPGGQIICPESGSGTPGTAWGRELAQAIRSPQELLRYLNLDDAENTVAATGGFPLLVPMSFVCRMSPGDRHDPLLLQVLPVREENRSILGFTSDAVADSAARKLPGLLQKYKGRALLMTTGSCAVHCRYCFRREYPYGDEPRRLDDWMPALDALRNDSTIREVILSGGDPLMLTDDRLEELCRHVESIPHLDRLRIHSRLPIVLPSRVTSRLLELLRSLRTQTVFVVHANHANEIRDDCEAALRRLVQSGLPVLNQSVLLRDINDSVDALEQLSLALINLGVIPYYLHQLDRVTGTAHFEVSSEVGMKLVRDLRSRVPGYAVPEYVREIPGEPNKTPMTASSDHSVDGLLR